MPSHLQNDSCNLIVQTNMTGTGRLNADWTDSPAQAMCTGRKCHAEEDCMPKIPYPDVSALPEIMQKMLAGTPLNVVRIGALASQPLFEAQGQLAYAIANPAVLDPRIRETAILRVAYMLESDYELYHHQPLARAAGLNKAEMTAIMMQDYASLPPVLAAVAAFADELVTATSPRDETLAQLRSLVSDQIVINLILTIGNYMTIARLIATTGVELDSQFLEQLPQGH
jgi:4-carboxymuconolactone decarboxylase